MSTQKVHELWMLVQPSFAPKDARSAGIALGWRFQVNRMVQQLVASKGAGVTCVPWNTDSPVKTSRTVAEWLDD